MWSSIADGWWTVRCDKRCTGTNGQTIHLLQWFAFVVLRVGVGLPTGGEKALPLTVDNYDCGSQNVF